MEELFIILAYTPEIEQQNQLRNFVFKLKQNNKKVLIASHNHIPDDIIKLADYYLYDSDNLLIDVADTNGRVWLYTDNFSISTPYDIFKYTNYSIQYSKSMYHGLMLAKQCGYNIVHALVYDTDFQSLDEFDSNVELLKDYDCVFYDNEKDIEPFPIGHFTSFNVSKYSLEELSFNQNKLISELLELNNGFMVEKSTWVNLIKPKNYYLKKEKDIDTSKLTLDLSTITFHPYKNLWCCFCIEENTDNIMWFTDNQTSNNVNYNVIINDAVVFHNSSKINQWNLNCIGNLNEVDNIKVYKDNKFIKEFDFVNKILKNDFKIKSIFTKQ